MGGPTSGRRSASSTPGYPAPRRRRCQGKATTGFQWGRPEPGCSGNTSPRDAGAIYHRGAVYPGRAQESPGGRHGPTGRKLYLPKAGVPLGTSRRDFLVHAGSLGPHRAHAQHSARGPGSPRQRAPSPQPSGPPRREGAPRLPPQTWGTLRQRGGSESLARTTRSAGFQPRIRRAPFPTRFRTPTTITKYSGETRPELWLADYRLACQLGRTDDDNLIICNLPLFLSDTARAWLEHLPPGQISNWDDLVQAFAGNFQGTYVRPRNSWDLRSYRQQPEESLQDYIRRFSKQRTELPNVTDSDVIGAFLAGTTCRDLVSKLGRKLRPSSGRTSSPRAAHRKMSLRHQLNAAPRRKARRSRKRNAMPPTRTLSPPPSTRTLGNLPGVPTS
jgi:hypothetical protein